jgi:prepilin-type processing-associated H-X9-DG protein
MMHQMTGAGGTYTDWNGTQSRRVTGYVNVAFLDGSVRSVAWTVDRYPAKALEGVRVRPDRVSPTW